MKKLVCAISLLIASTLATAADPQVSVDESLVLAYTSDNIRTDMSPERVVSQKISSRAALSALNEVSASLGAELDARIAKVMTAE